jgi:hypothetical protein
MEPLRDPSLDKTRVEVTNTLAYYDAELVTALKRCIVQAPGWQSA